VKQLPINSIMGLKAAKGFVSQLPGVLQKKLPINYKFESGERKSFRRFFLRRREGLPLLALPIGAGK
jgi:hypothetical protein